MRSRNRIAAWTRVATLGVPPGTGGLSLAGSTSTSQRTSWPRVALTIVGVPPDLARVWRDDEPARRGGGERGIPKHTGSVVRGSNVGSNRRCRGYQRTHSRSFNLSCPQPRARPQLPLVRVAHTRSRCRLPPPAIFIRMSSRRSTTGFTLKRRREGLGGKACPPPADAWRLVRVQATRLRFFSFSRVSASSPTLRANTPAR
jgi:hypothetical protein